jgi:hypothetical protein
MFRTPAGRLGIAGRSTSAEGAADIIAARCDRRPDLARTVAVRKFQGVMNRQGPTAWRRTSSRPLPPGSVYAVDAHGLLREPSEELGGVLDLAASRRGLAHLEGHQESEILAPR